MEDACSSSRNASALSCGSSKLWVMPVGIRARVRDTSEERAGNKDPALVRHRRAFGGGYRGALG